LRITGYADMPKIALTSEPPLPQDEILAQLLFGQSVRQLSPLQLAQIGQAVAVLGGISGLDPLMAIRRDLGLDRLAVGGGAGKGGVTLEAGKYLTRRIYVGARQATSGGTQARLQIDLTRHLRLETTLGTGGGAPTAPITPSNDPGSSLGLSYQLEY
jgi:translocation and assembly module TamB